MVRRAKPKFHPDPHHPPVALLGAGVTVPNYDAPEQPPRRRKPVILKEPVPVKARVAEVAGGTAANCAAVVCCCPIGIVNLLVLATVRLPAGLCRRALRTRARRRKEMKRRKAEGALLGPKAAASGDPIVGGIAGSAETENDEDEDDDDVEGELEAERGMVALALGGGVSELWAARLSTAEVEEMEKELCGKFYGTGFWRSPSQRDDER